MIEPEAQRLIDAALRWGETPAETWAERDELDTELAAACVAYRAANPKAAA